MSFAVAQLHSKLLGRAAASSYINATFCTQRFSYSSPSVQYPNSLQKILFPAQFYLLPPLEPLFWKISSSDLNDVILIDIRSKIVSILSSLSNAIWLIKRTFQPSIIRKKRKTGYLVRKRTVGGRRILKRRAAKGRWRLAGGL